MSRFIKLTHTIINTTYIQHIAIKEDKFILNFMSDKIDGSFLLGTGSLLSGNAELVLCKHKNYTDYKIISDWIDNGLK